MTLSPATRATHRAIAGLGFTQIVGWGTTFLMPAVLGRHMGDDLGLPSEIIFSGITVMFGVGAIFSPRVGLVIDRTGARTMMALGSVVYAISLGALAFSQGMITYLLCWAGLGVGSTLALSTPSSIALAQVAGPGARRAIGMLAIIGGFASTLFWPLAGALDVAVGWRGTLLIYAAIHLFACTPVHLLVLPSRPPTHPLATAGAAPAPTSVAPEHQRRIYLLLSLTLASGAFVFTGVMVHMIEILRGLGHEAAVAVFLASLLGPTQITIRLFELLFGHRYSIMNSAVFGSAMLAVGLGLALLDGGNFAVALACIVSYGFANGLKAVQRATLPLALFGRAQFGAYMGRLSLPQGIISASAPPILAAVLSNYGATGTLWLTFAIAAFSLATMILLARLARTIR
ncbi:MFS transporter [soil metagenome]